MQISSLPDADWHLEASRPENLIAYFEPDRPLSTQIGRLVERFCAVHALCETDSGNIELFHLRNALAFHLVKTSRWWQVEFCPRAIVGVQAPLFLTYVHAHLEHDLQAEMFYDMVTTRQYARGKSHDDLLVLHQTTDPLTGLRTAFALDQRCGFRFGHASHDQDLVWNGRSHADFTSAWLNAASIRALIAENGAACQELRDAEAEFANARPWHQSYFHARCPRHAVQAHIDLMARHQGCRTVFGRRNFDAILNDHAFRLAWAASAQHLSIADFLTQADGEAARGLHAAEIAARARAHLMDAFDTNSHPDLAEWLDNSD